MTNSKLNTINSTILENDDLLRSIAYDIVNNHADNIDEYNRIAFTADGAYQLRYASNVSEAEWFGTEEDILCVIPMHIGNINSYVDYLTSNSNAEVTEENIDRDWLADEIFESLKYYIEDYIRLEKECAED